MFLKWGVCAFSVGCGKCELSKVNIPAIVKFSISKMFFRSSRKPLWWYLLVGWSSESTLHEGQQEGMETEQKQENIEDGNVGGCVWVRRGCVKLEGGLGPRPRGYVDLVGYWGCGKELDYTSITFYLLFLCLPTLHYPKCAQMVYVTFSAENIDYISVIYTQTAPQVQLHSKPCFYSVTPCVTLHSPSFPKGNESCCILQLFLFSGHCYSSC